MSLSRRKKMKVKTIHDTRKAWAVGKKYGYRSGLEVKVQEHLKENGVHAKYEHIKIEWEDLMYRKYTPDFLLPNGVIVETKGLFTAQDRRKHLLIKQQHPMLDVRFVFERADRKLSKVSKSTYASWCEKNGFQYAVKYVPLAWAEEEPKNYFPEKLIIFKDKKHES
jgi:hypothetical protein